ncbi:MAG: Rieske 2Fe-2S domain-containing protein [Anaerolineae bacterium]|nr:Rieske 2Fe-2S domain-containing protein [Anaerolineae bacterium]MBT7070179.1 Rieske 2Fe-2S domain-containing protein [Anaerolineae bacterium]MBT7324320.1 Rieske 2Fe-2S domain-containing protein [Anaerolineae bacterium]
MTEKKKEKIDRRQFLGLAWLGSILALTGESLAALFKFIQPIIDGGFGGMVKAGTLEEFPPGSITLVQEGRFFISRLDDGSFIALWQRCTHLGCSVPFEEDEDQFHCPCHGSLFDKLGIVQGGPAPRPMDYFPVIIEAGEVFVNTEEAFERKAFDPSQTTHS